MTVAASVEDIARALGQVTASPQGYKCRCPAHEDSKASLIINIRGNGDGRPTVHCFAGCSPQKIFTAIEDQTGMHFEAREKPSNRTQDKSPSIYPAPLDWRPIRHKNTNPSKHWEYRNAEEQLMFVVARYDLHDGKDIRPFSVQEVNGNLVWKQGLGKLHPLPLYNLSAVLANPNLPVLIVEGEKACDAAQNIPEIVEQFIPVAYQGGAKTWKKTDWMPLKGRRIFLWPDNDDAGREQFYELAKMLNIDQFCEEVKVAVIPSNWPNKWDLADSLVGDMNLGQVSWGDAPQGGIEFVLDSINPANYIEAFNALYWLYYDGEHRFTISRQQYVHGRGRAFDGYSYLQKISRNHPAYHCCFVGRESAIVDWANQVARRGDFVSGFRFRPGLAPGKFEEEGRFYVNKFNGFPFEPDQKGDCTIVKNHILHVICDGDISSYDYLWNYLSHIIQFPQEKPASAIVLKGRQGTGKTKFFEIVTRLLGGIGGYSKKIETMTQATDKFNNFLADSLFVWIEELQLTSSRERENRLKTMVSDPIVRVEAKYRDSYQDFNFARVGGATNHEHVWNVSDDDRRLSLFEVSEDRFQDKVYFAEMDKQLSNPSTMRRLMFELSTHPVDVSLIHGSFKNRARSKQAMHTPNPNQALALQLLKAGEILLRVLDERNEVITSWFVDRSTWEEKPVHIPAKLASQVIGDMIKKGKFLETAYTAKDKRITVSEMVRMMGSEKRQDGKYPYTTIYVSHRGGSRGESGYIIPKLSEARRAFCAENGLFYADMFDDNTVIPFRKKDSKPDDVPF